MSQNLTAPCIAATAIVSTAHLEPVVAEAAAAEAEILAEEAATDAISRRIILYNSDRRVGKC